MLDNIFGSKVRIRLLRFFFRNPDGKYGIKEIAERLRLSSKEVEPEIANLRKFNVIIKEKKHQ